MGINKFEIIPQSIGNTLISFEDGSSEYVQKCMNQQDGEDDFAFQTPMRLSQGVIIYTYDVVFKSSKDNNRWEAYMQMGKDEDVQWISLRITFLLTLLLSAFVAFILRMLLRRDLIKYEKLPSTSEDKFDDMGWKQVSRDVFRPPDHKMTLSVLIGTGIQLVALIICTLFLTCIGFIYQAHSGSLITMIIIIFVFTGSLNGYYTSKYYKYFKGEYWLLSTLLSNLAFPLTAAFIYLIQHLFFYFEDSSSSLSFKAIITFFALWIGIQTPLNLVGTFIGFKLESSRNPCKYYQIQQYVPKQPWYLEDFYACCFGGLLVFA